MYKSRRVLIYLHTRQKQLLVAKLGHLVYIFLVRDGRRNNTHIHAPLGCQLQCHHELVTHDKIWGKYINVLLCIIYHLHVQILTHILSAQRTGLVRLNISVTYATIVDFRRSIFVVASL